jgi:hypothetical protein
VRVGRDQRCLHADRALARKRLQHGQLRVARADSDNTGSRSLAWLETLSLSPAPAR